MFTSFDSQPIAGYTDYFVLDVSGLMVQFRREWEGILYDRLSRAKSIYGDGTVRLNMDVQMVHNLLWTGATSMDVSKIFSEAFASLKNEGEIDTDVPMFAYRDVQATVLWNFSQAKGQITKSDIIAIANELSAAAERMGYALYNYLKQEGFYHKGYFPYHFCGWFGESVLVELDDTHGGFTDTPDSLRLPYYRG